MAATEPIYSSLGSDPVLGEIVEIFVAEMPARIETLASQAAAGDFASLERTAHQLKGAFGSHGFGQLTPIAFRLEEATRQAGSEEPIRSALNELIAMCERIRASGQDSRPR